MKGPHWVTWWLMFGAGVVWIATGDARVGRLFAVQAAIWLAFALTCLLDKD